MYKVKKMFADLQDNNYVYLPNDIFPRKGLEVSAERIAELASKNNKRGEVLIELVEEAPAKATKKTAKK